MEQKRTLTSENGQAEKIPSECDRVTNRFNLLPCSPSLINLLRLRFVYVIRITFLSLSLSNASLSDVFFVSQSPDSENTNFT